MAGIYEATLERPVLVIGHDSLLDGAVLASTGAEQTLSRGQLLGRVTASRKLVPWTPGAADGSEVACAILAEDVTVPAAGDQNAQAYVHGEFKKDALGWGAATADQIDDCLWALRGRGIYAR